MKNALVKQNEKKVVNIYQERKDDLIKMKSEFRNALPKHISEDKFIRIALTQLRQNPKLQKCSRISLLGSFMRAAQLGLEPGLFGQCYLIPYGNDCQFQIGYQGLLELIRRSGNVFTIHVDDICENDTFEEEVCIDETINPFKIKHKKPLTGSRGNVLAYYGFIKYKDGSTYYKRMTVEEINYVRDTFSKQYNYKKKKGEKEDTLWHKHYQQMAFKTVLIKVCKLAPKSTETKEAIEFDNKIHNYMQDQNESYIVQKYEENEKNDGYVYDYDQETQQKIDDVDDINNQL